jgi:ribonuclease P protein component
LRDNSTSGDAMPVQSPARIRKPVAAPRPEFRLRKHADYQRVYREGKRQSLPLMTYFFAARQPQDATAESPAKLAHNHTAEISPGSRVGLTAGRVLGNAVVRNRIKRRMRQAVRHAQAELTANVDVVLHPRRTVLEAEFSLIERDVLRAFRAVQQALKPPGDADPSHGN